MQSTRTDSSSGATGWQSGNHLQLIGLDGTGMQAALLHHHEMKCFPWTVGRREHPGHGTRGNLREKRGSMGETETSMNRS